MRPVTFNVILPLVAVVDAKGKEVEASPDKAPDDVHDRVTLWGSFGVVPLDGPTGKALLAASKAKAPETAKSLICVGDGGTFYFTTETHDSIIERTGASCPVAKVTPSPDVVKVHHNTETPPPSATKA